MDELNTRTAPDDVVEAMALRLAKAADQAILGAGDVNCGCATAYQAGAGPSVEYWNSLALAALQSRPADNTGLVREIEYLRNYGSDKIFTCSEDLGDRILTALRSNHDAADTVQSQAARIKVLEEALGVIRLRGPEREATEYAGMSDTDIAHQALKTGGEQKDG